MGFNIANISNIIGPAPVHTAMGILK